MRDVGIGTGPHGVAVGDGRAHMTRAALRAGALAWAGVMLILAVAAAPAPRQPTPADELVGQHVTICSYGVRLETRVARAEWTREVAGATAPGNEMWAVAVVDVTNQGAADESLYTFARLRDERGREFKWAQYSPDPIDLAAAYGVKGSYESFAPGVTEQSVMVFAVASDARTLTLEADPADPASCAHPDGVETTDAPVAP